MRGHNENAFRLDTLATDARRGLERVAQGEADAIEGWLAYGAALNEGRALFPGDREFGQWVENACSSNLEVHPAEQSAAMWAAANAEQFVEARAASNARTVRGIHAKWKEIEAEREKEERRKAKEAEREAKAEEAKAAQEEAAKAEQEAREEAARAKSEEERKAAEARAEEAAKAREEAEQQAAEAEKSAEPEPEPDPLAPYRKGLSSLTREGLEDEAAGLRADLADAKAKLRALRDENKHLKEQVKNFEGDQAEVIRRLTRAAEHKSNEAFRASENLAAEKRRTYAMGKEIEELKRSLERQEFVL